MRTHLTVNSSCTGKAILIIKTCFTGIKTSVLVRLSIAMQQVKFLCFYYNLEFVLYIYFHFFFFLRFLAS